LAGWTCWHVGAAGVGQLLGHDDPVEQLLADTQLERGLLEGEVLVDGEVRDLGGLVVAITGDSAVTIITERSMLRRNCAWLSLAPSTRKRRKWSHMSARIVSSAGGC
jgi:hypothetical protein